MKRFLKRVPTEYWIITGAFIAVSAAIGSASWYGYNQLSELSSQIARLEEQFSSRAASLEESIEKTGSSLSTELEKEKQNVAVLKGELGSFQEEVSSKVVELSGSVLTLEKLSKIDPELLYKYSKVFFLNEHYIPERLVAIPLTHLYIEREPESIHSHVLPHLVSLLEDAKKEGVTIYVRSAYRSFDKQRGLKGIYTVIYGAGTANQFSADQGYSEHQLGTTVDFITIGLGGQLQGFENTNAYRWLVKNAHRYGFTLSYPEGNTYYIFEPWHWRFVGVKLATDLYENGKHFYDLEQREIDKYLISLFD
jgi:D-alanyl-D-alanine carboxypeptidase